MKTLSLRSAILIAVSTAILSFGLGFMASPEYGFDRHSYLGGVTYVNTRFETQMQVDITALAACELYVQSGNNELDGYSSDEDFYQGCEDAYHNRPHTPSTSRPIAAERGTYNPNHGQMEFRTLTDVEAVILLAAIDGYCRENGCG